MLLPLLWLCEHALAAALPLKKAGAPPPPVPPRRLGLLADAENLLHHPVHRDGGVKVELFGEHPVEPSPRVSTTHDAFLDLRAATFEVGQWGSELVSESVGQGVNGWSGLDWSQ